MGATRIIAVYLAVVSTATFAWLLWADRQAQRRRGRLRRPFASVTLRSRPPAGKASNRDDFFVDVSNLGHDELRIARFGIAVSGGRDVIEYTWTPAKQLSVPGVAAPAHDAVSVSVPVPSSAADGAFTAPFAVLAIAWVELAAGTRIHGQWTIVAPTRAGDVGKRGGSTPRLLA